MQQNCSSIRLPHIAMPHATQATATNGAYQQAKADYLLHMPSAVYKVSAPLSREFVPSEGGWVCQQPARSSLAWQSMLCTPLIQHQAAPELFNLQVPGIRYVQKYNKLESVSRRQHDMLQVLSKLLLLQLNCL